MMFSACKTFGYSLDMMGDGFIPLKYKVITNMCDHLSTSCVTNR